MIIDSYSEEETFHAGVMCATEAKKGDIFCLYGDIGAGKTAFSKGFAYGLQIEDEITSPTFTIVNEYEGIKKLYHFDVYRITDVREMEDVGFDDYLFGDGVCLIEWADLVEELLPTTDNVIKITISKDLDKGDEYRSISIGE